MLTIREPKETTRPNTEFTFHPIIFVLFVACTKLFHGRFHFEGPFQSPKGKGDFSVFLFGPDEEREKFSRCFEKAVNQFRRAIRQPGGRFFQVLFFSEQNQFGLLGSITGVFADHGIHKFDFLHMTTLKNFNEAFCDESDPCAMLGIFQMEEDFERRLPELRRQLQALGGTFDFDMFDETFRDVR